MNHRGTEAQRLEAGPIHEGERTYSFNPLPEGRAPRVLDEPDPKEIRETRGARPSEMDGFVNWPWTRTFQNEF